MRRLIRFALLQIPLFMICFASAHAGPVCSRSPVKIPFVLERGEIYVDAFVDGQGPFRFVVDTGASGAGRVDVKLVESLRLRVTGTTTNSDLVNTATISTVTLKSLRVGSLEQHGVEVLSRDYNEGVPAGEKLLMGIIGREFFSACILTIDYARHELVVSEGSLGKSDANAMSYSEPFLVPIKIGDHDAVGYLDTGSNLQMHLPMEWVTRLRIPSLQDGGKGYRANTVFNLFKATLPVPVRIAGNTLADVDAHFSEQANRINIGSALLARNQCVVAIDQSAKIIHMRCGDRKAG